MTNDDARARSLQFLKDEELSYQEVELPGGVATPGRSRSYLDDILFDKDMSGRTFLDIGSYLGYFCLEATRRGATATGIETDPRNVRQARGIAELWQLAPQYLLGDFESWDFGKQRFNTIACLNVLHHLYDPIHALRKMMALATDRIVLEVAVPVWRDVWRDRINPLRLAGMGAPAIFLGKPKKRGDAAGRTFLFTPRALRLLFNVHTTLFDPITVKASPFKGRMIVEARKRQIGHLVIVSGPTSSGKSTLCSKLQQDAHLRKVFGLEGDSWPVVQASELDDLQNGRLPHMILHYDMLRPSRTGIRSFDRDPVLHLMKAANQVTILTVVAPLDRMRMQLQKGEIGKSERSQKQRKRDADLLKQYETTKHLAEWYESWAAFCAREAPTAMHLLADNQGTFTSAPIAFWRSILTGTPR